jgi:hypothetical protein
VKKSCTHLKKSNRKIQLLFPELKKKNEIKMKKATHFYKKLLEKNKKNFKNEKK